MKVALEPARRLAAVPEWMAREKVPGLAVTVVADGAIAWSATWGVAGVDAGATVGPETVFEAASLSKQVFAHAVLRLCDAGALDLDRPLSEHLDAPYDEDPRIGAITVRHVLSHTTGFPNWRGDQRLRTHFAPGDRFSYSGEGFQYLQHAVERVVAEPVHDYLRRELLAPAGMHSASFVWTGQERRPVACPHDAEGRRQPKGMHAQMNAAYTLHCTADDYARFLLVALDGDGRHPLALSPALQAEMLRPHAPVNDSLFWQQDWPRQRVTPHERIAWGLGWGLHDDGARRAIWQWGASDWRSFVLADPDAGTGAVLMANSCNGGRLWQALIEALFGAPFEPVDWVESHLGL